MAEKTELEKLRILIPHWVEHSHSHQEEFDKWAEIALKEGNVAAAEQIKQALVAMVVADSALERALKHLGGPVGGHHHHHHH